ncbi:hypothetical protein C3B61_17545 [Cryobacterium zongtaii]|uniref:Uncharacterized protein n=1 Tax=Cryobacterium zongtaii TaxID=1259217 RepID=A0A2S3ZAP1_9MICO|nr:hypothetical protein [Cryobacterium zongtaii]POH62643.1 hypothetical protein C3B61_17545 [Cryobacterium zongtaii]
MSAASGQWFDGSYAEIQPWFTVALTLFCIGLIVVGIGVALLLLAVLDAVTPPFTVRPVPSTLQPAEPTTRA